MESAVYMLYDVDNADLADWTMGAKQQLCTNAGYDLKQL